MRVADYIVKTLESNGVDIVFGLVGGLAGPLFDALGRSRIRYVAAHHEQCSGIAADAYARQSGKIGVCFATGGPGVSNLATAAIGAFQDSIPVLFIVGQSKSTQTIAGSGIAGLRQYGVFEVDAIPMLRHACKIASRISTGEAAPWSLDYVMRVAQRGRPGPALVEIPLDVQDAECEPQRIDVDDHYRAPNETEVRQAMETLGAAQRPLIVAGHGVRCAHAVDLFRQRVKAWGVPCVTTHLASDLLHYDHPQFVGHCGPRGDRAANYAVQNADVILILGCSLNPMTTGWDAKAFAPQARKLIVEMDAAVRAKNRDVGDHIPACVLGFLVQAGDSL